MDIVVISLLALLPQLCFGVSTGNLAHAAYAVQSSTYNELADAQHAIDGDRDSNYMSGSCTHTAIENNPWLRVDLKNIYSVNKIIITNRGDCCSERIEGAQIRIGNSLDNNGNNNQLAATIFTAPRNRETYTFNPINGRYINIFLPGIKKILSLCELEVYTGTFTFHSLKILRTSTCSPCSTGNLAHAAYAVQSSTYNELADAQHAIDGDRDSNYMSGSCTHTAIENNPWLRVDLKNIYSVNKIIITNRGDCCSERIEGAQIRIGNRLDNNGNNNQLAATILTPPMVTETFEFNPIRGRYVNIFLPGMQKVLTLCEVEVYTGNLAHAACAVQSSTYNELADAQHAIDGDRDSNYMSGSCTHTAIENNPWLRVDLKNIYSVNKIIITNRGDCCAERIEGAQIRIGNSLDNNGNNNQLAATIFTAPRNTETYTFNPINGRYINIFLPGIKKILSLCELEVYTGTFTFHSLKILRTSTCSPCSTGNLAHAAYAVQSSTYNELADAQHAIDGDRDSNYMSGSCTHTAIENNPWLRLDLKNIYSVNKIIITNRGDCCSERIEGAQIRIGNSLDNNGNNNQLAATILTPPMVTETFEFNPIRGRYVNIFLPGMQKVLTLCEVEVYTG